MTRSQSYFSVLAHECVHWTGHGSRLDRNLSKRFGKAEAAAEELVAEIGAAFLCAELGITQDVRADHAQYLANWLQLLKNDPKAIFTAAARASEAVNNLNGLQHSGPRTGPASVVPGRAAAGEAAMPVSGAVP
jgi:antirestriction protein ArdC